MNTMNGVKSGCWIGGRKEGLGGCLLLSIRRIINYNRYLLLPRKQATLSLWWIEQGVVNRRGLFGQEWLSNRKLP